MRFVRRSPVENRPPDPPVDSREAEIARVAYFLAQARGFGPGRELEDWLAAEREVDARRDAGESSRAVALGDLQEPQPG